MLTLLRWFSKEGEFGQIVAAPSIHPSRADLAHKAIVKAAYENRGIRDDGVRILVTKTQPPMVVAAQICPDSGSRPTLRMLHVAEVRGEGLRLGHA
ncbi:MAG TPA: hypothetical protein VGD10_06135 [Allosphingosinicella sp.]|uniref:hypothetical protein n=1 Tax=Allosphingosinicella sp. TaxID=2823234 RepID=UPI002EDAA17C